MSTQPLRLKIKRLKRLINSENLSASPPDDMVTALREKYENFVYKMDLMDEILTDLSVIIMCKENAQDNRPKQRARRALYAVVADGFVTLKVRGGSWESRPIIKRYPIGEECNIEVLKAHLANIGVLTIVPPPRLVNSRPEDAIIGGEAVDAMPPGDGQ